MNFNNILLRSAVFRNRIGASKQTLFPTQISRRAFTSSRRGLQQQSSQSTPQTEKPNSTFKDGISAYRPFGAPFLKVFLGAIFTYQVIYYLWMKLETSEKKLLKNEEIKELEKEAKRLATGAKS